MLLGQCADYFVIIIVAFVDVVVKPRIDKQQFVEMTATKITNSTVGQLYSDYFM